MNTHNLSRRRWLGGLLAALTAGLCPRRAAAPRHSVAPLASPPSQFADRRACIYDTRGRLVSVSEHPPRPAALVRNTCVTNEYGVTSTSYYFG